MDLSKLPKLSETPPPPPQVEQPTPRARITDVEAGNAADIWLSIAIGLILMLMSPRLFQYLLSPATFPQKWTFSDPQGNPLPYTKTVFFWGDLALMLFAAVLIVEGIVLALGRRRAIFAAACALTIVATVLNFGYVAVMMVQGHGFQLFSAIATAIGVYIALHQWKLFQMMRA